MKTLLRIDASIRQADSVTRALTGYYEQAWLSANPGGRVIRRCLTTQTLPHLTQQTFEAFRLPAGSPGASALSDALVDELKAADELLIGSPLYNLSLPSTLKAYFDHVVRSGVTFEIRQGEYRGLLAGKRATLVTARGGQSSPAYEDEHQTAYLKNILAFIGIVDVDVVALEGMALEPQSRERALQAARLRVDSLLHPTEPPAWVGEFSLADKQAISFLRAGQAAAIVQGDARAYADLCTDDIHLMIPKRDVVSGAAAFLEAQTALFSNARFESFRKHPLRVERSGNLAIEVGRQEVDIPRLDAQGGIFAARQKYTHVFRHTDKGWRFALLMSNPCE